MMRQLMFAAGLALASATAAMAQAPAPEAPWPEATIEIYKLAPGKQEAFLRRVARDDQVTKAAGLPPNQVFVHEDGAEWDVLLLKPHRTAPLTPAQEATMAAKRKEVGVESGPAFFVALRELVASHTDTTVYGPITAGQWLAKLDAWRAEHPPQGTK